MPKNKSTSHSLANPTRLKPIDKKDGMLQVIIETPKGSRNKFSFDPDQEIFSLKKVLPAGMVFPYDFGFLPRTLADDGDPIDVLLLMDEPAFPGVLVVPASSASSKANRSTAKNHPQRPPRRHIRGQSLIRQCQEADDLPKHFIKELENFCVNYHRLEGKEYKLLGCKQAPGALRLIKQAKKAA